MPGKARITIYLDRDVVDWFKVRAKEPSGGQYQTLINDALREHVDYERTRVSTEEQRDGLHRDLEALSEGSHEFAWNGPTHQFEAPTVEAKPPVAEVDFPATAPSAALTEGPH